jgi:hypothetical protein
MMAGLAKDSDVTIAFIRHARILSAYAKIKNTMRFLAVSLLFLNLPCAASLTNQTGGGDGGSLRPLPGQNPAIRMVREKVRINFSKIGSYSIVVDYVFRNEGPERNVSMGLPENDMFAMDNVFSNADRGLAKLTISIDGRGMPVQRRIVNRNSVSWPNYNALSVIQVPFQKRQTRHIRVRYQSYMWGSCGHFMIYSFAGHRWKGTVEQSSVTMVNGGEIYYDKEGDPGVTSPTMPLRQQQNRSYFRWNNWHPDGGFLVG